MQSFVLVLGNSGEPYIGPITMHSENGESIAAGIEKVKEVMGLRWNEVVEGREASNMRVEVIVHSCGLGWEAFSSNPPLYCSGRTPGDALGFYRFCLSEYEKGMLKLHRC